MILKAIMFWNEVYEMFPCLQVYNWMDAIANDNADWFRNYSLTRIAITAHSKNSREFHSRVLYDKNMRVLEKIEAKHQDLISLMQW